VPSRNFQVSHMCTMYIYMTQDASGLPLLDFLGVHLKSSVHLYFTHSRQAPTDASHVPTSLVRKAPRSLPLHSHSRLRQLHTIVHTSSISSHAMSDAEERGSMNALLKIGQTLKSGSNAYTLTQKLQDCVWKATYVHSYDSAVAHRD